MKEEIGFDLEAPEASTEVYKPKTSSEVAKDIKLSETAIKELDSQLSELDSPALIEAFDTPAGPNQTISPFIREFRKDFGKKGQKSVAKSMGKGQVYKDYLYNNMGEIINNVPVGYVSRNFPYLVTKGEAGTVGTTGRDLRWTSGPKGMKIKEGLTEADRKQFVYDLTEVGRLSTKKNALAYQLADSYGVKKFTETLEAQRNNAAEILKLEGDFELTQNEYRENKISKEDFQERRSEYVSEMSRLLKESNMMDNFNKNLSPESVLTPETIAQKLSQQIEVSNFRKSATLNKEFRKFAEEMAESTGELPDNFYLEAQENFQSKKPLLVVDLLSRKKDIVLSRKDFREAFQKVYGEVEFVKGKKLSKENITKIAHEMFDQSAYVEKHYEVARQRRLEDVKNNKQSREELMFNLERQFDKAFENTQENVRLKQQLGVEGTAKELMNKDGQIDKNLLHEQNYWIKRLNNSTNKVNEVISILKGNLGHYASAGGPRGHRQQFFSGKPDVFAEMNKTFKDLGLDIEIKWDTAADGSLKAKSTRILKNGKEVVSGAELADRLFQPSQKAEGKWLKLTDQEWIDKNPKEFEALRKEFVERGEAAGENKQAVIDKIEYDFASFKLGQIDAVTQFLSLDQLNTNMIGALRAGAPLHSVMKPFKGDIIEVLTLEHMRAAQVLVDGLVSISRRADSWKGINEKGLETNNLKETVDYKFSDSALDMINKLYEKYNTAIITQEKLGVTAGESVDALITSVGNKTKEPFVARGYDGELIYPRLINEATAGSPFFRSMIDLQKLFETGKVSEAEYGKTLVKLAKMNNKKPVVEADKVELESSGIYNKSSLKGKTVHEMVESTGKMDKALDNSRKINPKIKKARVFDFDDTVARTSSKVFYDKPNLTGKPTPKRKAIFMIGGPGSGKTNIGKGLELGREGWKVVNQDIFIEGAKKEAGLPESESGYTAEQRSQRAKIGAAGMKAAKDKLKQYTEAGEGMVIDGTGASYKATMKKINDLKAKGYEVHMIHAKTSPEAAKKRNKNRPERSLPSWIVGKTQKSVDKNVEQYKKDFGDKFMEIDTEQIEYGKPLPKEFVDMVKSNIYKNERGILNAEEFAKQGDKLTSEGAKMDFSDFNRVVDGKKGPLFDLMKKMKEAEGDRDMFILTARSQESATAIHEFLKANGIDIPLDNIKGLGNSTGEAKAEWLVGKAAEGYNDFYFADDAIANVDAVKKALEPIDVKSQVQQARMNKSSVDMNETFNKYLEAKTGIEWQKEFSEAKATVRGAKKGRFKFWIPPSASDFSGLMDATLGKGKEGEAQRNFYNEVLYKPYSRAQRSVARDRTQLMADFKALKKELNVPKDLREITESGFSKEQAVRVHLWNKLGFEVPGLSKTDLAELNKIVTEDATLSAFAEQILSITKGDGYSKPGKHWLSGTITTDFMNLLNTTKRNKYLEEWQANVDVLFSTANLNKLEASFGPKYREALENSLARMKAGKNRIQGGNRLSNRVLDYINNAQGTIMFFNMRSAVLQSLSATNFLNFGFNNPIKAGKAFANQPQYWKDFMEIMNSEYLLDRRNGLKINIAENEIADAASTSKNKAKAAINYILEKGYLPTKFMDSFAIASGGATWYRNRIKSLIKEGKSEAEAKETAMEEFIEISEKSQQSSDPSKISQQQSGDMGRILLQFVNTPMQYARLQKAEALDILNRRGNPLKKAGKILYYGAIQNMWFNLMQQGLFAIGFDDDMGDVDIENKVADGVNGMVDSTLRGLGMGGMTVSVLKNFLIDVYERSGKKQPKYKESLFKLLEFSPAIKSKFSKLSSVAWMMEDKITMDKMKNEGFSLNNPAWKAMAKILSATVNIPLDRAYQKLENVQFAMDEETEAWQSVFAWLGWPEYQLTNMQDKEAKRQKEKDDLHYRTAIEDPSKYTKEEQIDILKQHGYSDDDIKKMKNEGTRVATIKKAEQDNNVIYTSEKSKGKQSVKKEEKTYSPYLKEEEVSELSGESDEDRKTTLNVKKYRDMNKSEQEQKLWDLGYTKKYIRSLNTEDKRVDVLLREIENDSIPARLQKSSAIPKSERTKQQHRLYDLNKQAQIDTLLSLGLSDSLINALNYEADRVKKIEELYEERNK